MSGYCRDCGFPADFLVEGLCKECYEYNGRKDFYDDIKYKKPKEESDDE